MPIEFKLQNEENSSDSTRLAMMYDGSGRRISKTFLTKSATAASWDTVKVTHYTGIGTEIRENYHNESLEKAKVVVNMPEGLGRYGIEDAKGPDMGFGAGYIPNVKFEWYLKNHLGSTMLVYGTEGNATSDPFTLGMPLAAYDYRAFGEQLTLLPVGDKFTENFTGKELDDEIALNYFGARYLDPMLGLWISVDPKRQYQNSYLYAGNNPIALLDPDGNEVIEFSVNAGGYAGLGGSLKFGFVVNTEDFLDCGIVYGASVGAGIAVDFNVPFGMPIENALLGSVANSAFTARSAHDLESNQWNGTFSAGLGVSVELGKNPIESGINGIVVGELGVKASYDIVRVTTLRDMMLLGRSTPVDEGRSLLPTSGPAPADNSNVAVYKDLE